MLQNAAKEKISADSQRARDEANNRFTQLKQTLTKQVNRVKGALPDLDRVRDDFKHDIQTLEDELLSDEEIKHLVEF